MAGALWTPAGVVVAGPDAGHVARRRDEPVRSGAGVERLHPRPVQGCELGVVAAAVHAPVLDLLGVEVGRRVDDGDAVPHQLAVGDGGELHGLDGFQVDGALLVGGHQVRHGDHGHLVDGFQAAEPGAVGGVADVVVHVQLLSCWRFGFRLRCDQLDGALVRFDEGAAGGNLLDGDDLRFGADLGGDVVVAALGGDVVPDLGRLALHRDDDLELVLGRILTARVGNFHGDGLRVGGAGFGRHAVPAEFGRRGRRHSLRLLLRLVLPGSVGADAHHVAVASAVEEVAVDGVGKIRARDEVPEGFGELGPVGHKGWLIVRPLGGKPDECSDCCAYSLDWTSARSDLVYIHTWRKIARHFVSSLNPKRGSRVPRGGVRRYGYLDALMGRMGCTKGQVDFAAACAGRSGFELHAPRASRARLCQLKCARRSPSRTREAVRSESSRASAPPGQPHHESGPSREGSDGLDLTALRLARPAGRLCSRPVGHVEFRWRLIARREASGRRTDFDEDLVSMTRIRIEAPSYM